MPGERQPLAVLRIDVPRHEDRVFGDAVGLHAALDQVDVQVHESAHLDGAAERDLAVTLGEVQVTHREASHRRRRPDRSTLVPLVKFLMSWLPPFSRGGCGAGGLGGDPVNSAPERLPRMAESGSGGSASGGTRSGSVSISACSRAFHLAEQRRRWCGPHQPRVHDAGVGDRRHVPRRRDPAAEVPDHLVGVGELLGEEPAAVLGCEHAGVAPALAGQRPRVLLRDRADIEDVDDEQVARFRARDGDRPAEHVHARKRRVENILGGVVVVDGTVEPLATVHAEDIARFDLDLGRDVRMPPVVANDLSAR